MMSLRTPALLLTLLLTACTTPVGTQDSGIQTPSNWSRFFNTSEAKTNPVLVIPNAPVEHQWWKQFNDPTLDALITETLANNKNLAIAKARIEEARAARLGASSLLFPQLDATASSSRANQGMLTGDRAITINQASLEAGWEIDLFGKNQSRLAAAQAIAESEEAAQQATTVALLAEVARNYFDLRNYEQQIALTEQNLETQKKTLSLIEEQKEGGMVGDFDQQRAAAQASTTESLLPTLHIAYDTTLNRLNTLLGAAPGTRDTLLKTPASTTPLNAQTIIAAPATVLANRPDVRAAERRYAASISERQSATATLFPAISLLGLFGVQDANSMSATPWGITASLIQPILNFGRISSQIDAADARQQQAFLTYQQTVLDALENMENALSNYLNETRRNASLQNAVAQNRKASELARQQYTSGFTGLLDVLTSERNVLDAESSLAASDAKLRKDMVSIYTAAGGGWNVPEAKTTTPKP